MFHRVTEYLKKSILFPFTVQNGKSQAALTHMNVCESKKLSDKKFV